MQLSATSNVKIGILKLVTTYFTHEIRLRSLPTNLRFGNTTALKTKGQLIEEKLFIISIFKANFKNIWFNI
jgi:hypothetical protein